MPVHTEPERKKKGIKRGKGGRIESTRKRGSSHRSSGRKK